MNKIERQYDPFPSPETISTPKNDPVGQIFILIPTIMREVGSISKDRKNNQQGYNFRGIDDLYLALQSPLAKHGVFYAPEVLNVSREERTTKAGGLLIYTTLTVRYTFYASDASSFSVITVGEAMDSGDKSANKAMSAALKYALLQVFCIPTEEDNDTENNSPDPAPKKQTGRNPFESPIAMEMNDRQDLVNKLNDTAKRRGWINSQLSSYIAETFKKKPADLSIHDLKDLIDEIVKYSYAEAIEKFRSATTSNPVDPNDDVKW